MQTTKCTNNIDYGAQGPLFNLGITSAYGEL